MFIDDPDSLTPVYEGLPTPEGTLVAPPAVWPYQDPVPIPDAFALFRRGSFGPFYPLYKAAVFLDTLYDKWGRFSNEHRVLMSLLAVNRADGAIVPTKDMGLRGASLRVDGLITNWSGNNRVGEITYGRIANYRLGRTRATMVTLRFAEPANCNILLEPSFDGAVISQEYVQGITVENATQVEVPFLFSAKWFNIRLEGQFNLVGISFQSEARGRR